MSFLEVWSESTSILHFLNATISTLEITKNGLDLLYFDHLGTGLNYVIEIMI